MEHPCPFCDWTACVLENELAYARYDLHPVNPGHLLLIPKRHYPDFFMSRRKELDDILDLVWKGRALLDELHRPDGYNIGVNCGFVSGQTVPHLHVHLIPRYQGDMEDPTGGVRGVIPHKQRYPASSILQDLLRKS